MVQVAELTTKGKGQEWGVNEQLQQGGGRGQRKPSRETTEGGVNRMEMVVGMKNKS